MILTKTISAPETEAQHVNINFSGKFTDMEAVNGEIISIETTDGQLIGYLHSVGLS